MHELGATKNLIKIITDEAGRLGVRKIKKIFIEMGELTTYKKEPIMFYFDQLKKDKPIIEDAELIVKEVQAKIMCEKCEQTSNIIDSVMIFCPKCESTDIRILEGKDFIIKKIET